MNQEKIGKFLKELRKQKGLTKEQTAEEFHASNRTISRWDNMPDLDVLIELSDYYEVDLWEILNGERKSGNMDKEMKETVLWAADYTFLALVVRTGNPCAYFRYGLLACALKSALFGLFPLLG